MHRTKLNIPIAPQHISSYDNVIAYRLCLLWGFSSARICTTISCRKFYIYYHIPIHFMRPSNFIYYPLHADIHTECNQLVLFAHPSGYKCKSVQCAAIPSIPCFVWIIKIYSMTECMIKYYNRLFGVWLYHLGCGPSLHASDRARVVRFEMPDSIKIGRRRNATAKNNRKAVCLCLLCIVCWMRRTSPAKTNDNFY